MTLPISNCRPQSTADAIKEAWAKRGDAAVKTDPVDVATTPELVQRTLKFYQDEFKKADGTPAFNNGGFPSVEVGTINDEKVYVVRGDRSDSATNFMYFGSKGDFLVGEQPGSNLRLIDLPELDNSRPGRQ